MLYVEKGTPAHAFELAFKLRQSDKFELALMGHDPLTALINPFRYTRPNVNTYTVLEKDNVLSMFGVVSTMKNPKIGIVWFLSSELTKKQWLYFLKRNKKWTEYFLSDYEYVSNLIPEENRNTIRWLKWQDFSFNDKEIFVKNVKVLYFYKKIHNVSNGIQPVLGDIGPVWITELS
jgi:hypothetical protein